MNTPPLLLGAAILFWGWQCDWWPIAVSLALLFEGARWIPRRADLEEAQQILLADVNVIVAAVAGVYFYVSYGNPQAIMLLFQWLPVLLLPLALFQAFGRHNAIDLKVLFWSLRRRPPREAIAVNLGYPYLGLWIIAASAANVRGESFYIGLSVLAAWVFWLARPRRFHAALWFMLFGLAVAMGYAGQLGLHNLQLWLEDTVPQWMTGDGSHTNPYRRASDIGHIGDLKQSESIVLRVRAERGLKTPLLLHSASYDDYAGVSWFARVGAFVPLSPRTGGNAWTLADGPAGTTIDINDHATLGDPVLNLPRGTVAVENLAALSVKRNALGAVQAEMPPGFVAYRALYNPAAGGGEAPTAYDLRLPKAEQAAFERVAQELGLKNLAPAEALARVRRFFADGFEYSIYQGKPAGGQTPLSEFLLNTRSGHCEYFASATTLLLRAANVPARYATGFSVYEWSPLEQAWLARQRHAHAWARVWVDGTWTDVDTTPPAWFDADAEARPWWAGVSDWASWARYSVSAWQEQASAAQKTLVFGLIGLAVIGWLGWRLMQGKGNRRETDATLVSSKSAVRSGLDSAFFAIEHDLALRGFPRNANETVTEWLARFGDRFPGDARELCDLALLHCRYRFDPRGLSDVERIELKRRAAAWMNSLAALPPRQG